MSGEHKLAPQRGPQTRFLSSSVDIVFYGGAAFGGKTYALLLWPLRWITNPRMSAVIFRRTYPEIEAPGGLWDESCTIYPLCQGVGSSRKYWTFPSGASITFSHMSDESDRFKWKSAQIPLIGFDQVETFTSEQVFYLFSRNRSMSGVPCQIRATCNPDPDSFVAKLIAWYIDPITGYAIPERSGVTRWFMRDRDAIVWADTPGELLDKFGMDGDVRPTSFTFIAAKISDNPIGVSSNPQYRSRLRAMTLVENQRLELGNWKIRMTAGNVFRREWFEVVDHAPDTLRDVIRYWDLGSTKTGDASAGVKLGRCHVTGDYYVLDVALVRDVPHVVEAAIRNTASQDGYRVTVGFSCDPGQAGNWQISHLVNALDGYPIGTRREKGDKVERAKPFSSQCGHGKVKIVRGEWNDAFLTELENFPSKDHDDQVDAVVNAHFCIKHSYGAEDIPDSPSSSGDDWGSFPGRTDTAIYQ